MRSTGRAVKRRVWTNGQGDLTGRQPLKGYGGIGDDSGDKGRTAFTALVSGGASGFNAALTASSP